MVFDVVVIGAGVVGLACARETAGRGLSTLVVERHESFGQDTSSRNSEVIHSGIYYPTGSLKATLCVRANHTIYDECEQLGVWTRQTGKLIVALDDQEVPELETLYDRALRNGVTEIEKLDARQVSTLEPHVRCAAALLLRRTGIIDSHELMRALVRDARDHSSEFAYGVKFVAGEQKNGALQLTLIEHHGVLTTIDARSVVNAGGLASDLIAAGFGIDIDAAEYRLHLNRGHYYSVVPARSKLVSRLIYPLPNKHLIDAGLHITIDRAAQVKLGPDAEYIDRSMPEAEWYKFDDSRREKFFTAVSRYFPPLERGDLSPNQVGVRPKRAGSETRVMDFVIAEESARGLPGLVNLIGIESPGLTCALEIGRHVSQIVGQHHKQA